jgi:site-specific DNA recombinase
VLEEEFSKLLGGLAIDEEIVEWVKTALRESHEDEKRHHDDAIAALQADYTKLQNRIDQMYEDKLDGRIDIAFFERKSAEWRAEQDRLLRNVREHHGANQTYLEEGLRVLELANRAAELFKKQPASEKRRLLDFMLSNCAWKDGKLTATFRQPFDIIAGTVANDRGAKAESQGSDDHSEIWLRLLDSNQRPGG